MYVEAYTEAALLGEGGGWRDSNQCEVRLPPPSCEPPGSTPREKACPVLERPQVGVGRVMYQGGFLEEVVLEAAALVSADRIAKSLLPSLPGSLWQPCSPVSWEAPSLAVRTLGEEGG